MGFSPGEWLSENVFGSHTGTGQADQDIANFRAMNQPYQADFDSAFRQQQGLVNQLNGVIQGRGPSLANATMANALGDVQAAGNAQAAGARGAGNVLARYGAQQSIADAQARMAGQAAMARAKEEADARAQLGQTLSGMGQQSIGMFNPTLEAYLDAVRRRQALDVQNSQANQAAFTAGLAGASDAYGQYASGGKSSDSGGGKSILGDALL